MNAFARLLLLGLLLCSSSAQAQLDPDIRHLTDFVLSARAPDRGIWYDPALGGTGWTIDVGPTGLGFMAFYAYTPDGAPVYYVMGAQYEPYTEAQRKATGFIGRMRGDLYQTRDGQCLGCAFRPPTETLVVGGPAELLFVSATQAEFRFSGTSRPLRTNVLTARPEDRPENVLDGRWMVAVRDQVLETVVVLDIVPQTTTVYPPFDAETGTLFEAPYSVQYRFKCTTLCRGPAFPNGNTLNQMQVEGFSILRLVLSYDPPTGRYAAHAVGTRFGTDNVFYSRRYNVLVRDNGRSLYLYSDVYRIANSDISASEVILTRLPKNFTPRTGQDGQ